MKIFRKGVKVFRIDFTQGRVRGGGKKGACHEGKIDWKMRAESGQEGGLTRPLGEPYFDPVNTTLIPSKKKIKK
jgi:hypothetical protein